MLDFFRTSKGIELDRAAKILQGGGNPGLTSDTSGAQVGSFYLDTTGDAFIKQLTGAGVNKWQVLATQLFVTTLLAGISWREPVEVADTISLVVPSGTPGNPIVVDGIPITNAQRVLFAAIVGAGGPNIYIYDQPSGTFSEDTNLETQGDNVFVKQGTYANRRFVFTGIVWKTYDAIYKNTTVVQKDPGIDQFGTINDAINYVATQSPGPTNPWTIVVYPGIYTEAPIIVPGYTHVTAIAANSVTVIPSNSANDVFTLGEESCLHGITVNDASAGRGVVIKDVQKARLSEIIFQGNENGVYIEGDVAATSAALHNITFLGGPTHLYSIRVVATGGQTTTVDVDSTILSLVSSTALASAVSVTGTGSLTTLQNCDITGADMGTGLYIEDGAVVSTSGLRISSVGLGLHVPNVGAAPKIYIQAQIVQDDAPNILIEHTGTLGFFSGAADHDEIIVATGTTQLSLAYNGTDATEAGDVGFTVVGSFLLGSEQSNTTDVTDLIQQASPTGVLSGGVITPDINPLDISVSDGYGYLVDPITLREKRIIWDITVLTLDDDAENYIYIDDAGVVTFAATLPNVSETIFLGRVRTLSGNIIFISLIPLDATASATFLDNFLRTAIGAIFGTGCIVTENVTPFELDITAGTYYYSKLTFTPSSATSATFDTNYHSSGNWTRTPGVTVVDNTQYDDGTDLTALTATFYTKHALYVGADGVNQVFSFVYGQDEYPTLLDAQTAPLPSPAPDFLDIIVPIAAIIVQEGATNITEFSDIRPRIGFVAPAVSGSIRHGDLLGLGDDDHTQYLLVNGTRAMSGDLDMGGNDITNVNLVDGIDVPAHGGRHGATSADPVPTAAPIANLTASTTNALGAANTLARSDHSHAITGFQVLDSDLTALAGIATTGIYVITGTGTSATRSLTQPAAGITISNDDGVAGNPTFALANDLLALESLATTGLAVRTALDTWTTRNLTAPAAGITISNNTGVIGNPTFALANDLAALEGLAGTGIAVRSAIDTWVQRTITGTASRIVIVNGDGVAGNPTIDISASYVGQASITTLGTITTGTWNGTTIATANGGTGLTTIGSANQILGVNTSATGLEYKTLTAGTGISITPAAGSITIAATGGNFIQRFTFQADQFDNPVTANWAVNALAPASADTVNSALTVRRFDDTVQEGVGGEFTIPTGAVNVVFYFKSRAQTAPGATQGVQPTFYHRLIADNAAVGAWSAALNLTAISIPTNTNFQYDSQTISLATLGWSVGEHRQFELTRRGTQAGDTLTGDWNLLEMIVEFTT